jgi:hypothetical protein
MTQTLRRLSEQDLAQLYLQTEAPLRLDDLLQGQTQGQRAQIDVHDSLSEQTPDLAVISLSLCGLIIARDFPHDLKDGYMGPILRELIVAAEDNLVTVGRLWLDTVCHDVKPDPKADRITIESIPDRMRILSSIFMELRNVMEDRAERVMFDALKTLCYQAESHSDLADAFVQKLSEARKRKSRSQRAVPVQIPLPFELTRPQAGAEIVSFSLFHQRR